MKKSLIPTIMRNDDYIKSRPELANTLAHMRNMLAVSSTFFAPNHAYDPLFNIRLEIKDMYLYHLCPEFSTEMILNS